MDFGQIEEINWRQPTCSYKNLEIKSLVDHHKRREFLIGVEFSGQIEEINWHQRTYFNHIYNLKRHLDLPNLISLFNHTRLIKLKSQNVDYIKSSDIDFNPTFSFTLFLPFVSDILLVCLHLTSCSSVCIWHPTRLFASDILLIRLMNSPLISSIWAKRFWS